MGGMREWSFPILITSHLISCFTKKYIISCFTKKYIISCFTKKYKTKKFNPPGKHWHCCLNSCFFLGHLMSCSHKLIHVKEKSPLTRRGWVFFSNIAPTQMKTLEKNMFLLKRNKLLRHTKCQNFQQTLTHKNFLEFLICLETFQIVWTLSSLAENF